MKETDEQCQRKKNSLILEVMFHPAIHRKLTSPGVPALLRVGLVSVRHSIRQMWHGNGGVLRLSVGFVRATSLWGFSSPYALGIVLALGTQDCIMPSLH